MSAKKFIEWAQYNILDAVAKGTRIVLFVLPLDAELMLLQAATAENLPPEEHRIDRTGTYICGVKVLWTDKLPHGQSWFLYKGGKEDASQ